MKVLLDENLDHVLRKLLSQYDVATVTYMGRVALQNGKLLHTAEQNGFDAFLTGDQRFRMSRILPGGISRLWRFRPFSYRSYVRTSQK